MSGEDFREEAVLAAVKTLKTANLTLPEVAGHNSFADGSASFGETPTTDSSAMAGSPTLESLFQLPKLLIQEVVCLVNKANHSVGRDFRRSFFNIGRVSPIGPILVFPNAFLLLPLPDSSDSASKSRARRRRRSETVSPSDRK